MGFEGLVSMHWGRPYRGERQKYWVTIKNRAHPAIGREL
jgi:ATP-dependent DNA ligase